MSYYPARDEMKERKIREAIELCGKNRGTHDYIPIEWNIIITHTNIEKKEIKKVTRLLCRTCFSNVSVDNLLKNYPDVSDLRT